MDRIAKERLNIILLIDSSKSMQGKRIKQVDQAIKDIKDYLIDLENENSNVDFYMTIIPFSTEAEFYNDERMIGIKNFDYQGIKCGGWSNLDKGYEKLDEILEREEKGGIMPDFGGVAPIILLLTDGHPSSQKYKEVLKKIQEKPWFKAALRYGIAIELEDVRTNKVLRDFVGNNGDVITCYSSNLLHNIIKIIVLKASEVKSRSTLTKSDSKISQTEEIKQVIAEALTDADDWEW